MPTLEICTGSLESIRAAARGGAQRVEVCAALETGGLTPSMGYLAAVLSQPLYNSQGQRMARHVLIRPRGGDFFYNDEEQDMIMFDIRLCKQLGAEGVVVGALTPGGNIDIDACTRFAEAAEGMSLTFHRAFDCCRHPLEAMEEIISMGYHRILTSGQAPRAEHAIPLLRTLVKQADGRIIIMPGSGITPANAAQILRETGATEIHASAKGQKSHDDTLFPGYFDTSTDIVAQILAEITKK